MPLGIVVVAVAARVHQPVDRRAGHERLAHPVAPAIQVAVLPILKGGQVLVDGVVAVVVGAIAGLAGERVGVHVIVVAVRGVRDPPGRGRAGAQLLGEEVAEQVPVGVDAVDAEHLAVVHERIAVVVDAVAHLGRLRMDLRIRVVAVGGGEAVAVEVTAKRHEGEEGEEGGQSPTQSVIRPAAGPSSTRLGPS